MWILNAKLEAMTVLAGIYLFKFNTEIIDQSNDMKFHRKWKNARYQISIFHIEITKVMIS